MQKVKKVENSRYCAKTPKLLKNQKILQGLPKVSVIIWDKEDQKYCLLTSLNGIVTFGKPLRNKQNLLFFNENGSNLQRHLVEKGKHILVLEGEFVHAEKHNRWSSFSLTMYWGFRWKKHFIILLFLKQQVYRSQRVNIADKRCYWGYYISNVKISIDSRGGWYPKFIVGDMISKKKKFKIENEENCKNGWRNQRLLNLYFLGYYKSCNKDSIISAASSKKLQKY